MTVVSVLILIAEIIGFTVLGFIALLFVLAALGAVHDFIRTRSLRYDRNRYDDVGRWNRRLRRRATRA
jgi:hypothetical protein